MLMLYGKKIILYGQRITKAAFVVFNPTISEQKERFFFAFILFFPVTPKSLHKNNVWSFLIFTKFLSIMN